MQTTPVAINRPTSGVSEAEAQRVADVYLAAVLGGTYVASAGFYTNGRWIFLIQRQKADGQNTIGIGKIAVESATAEVIALTEAQVKEMLALGSVLSAQARGEIAHDERGYVLLHYARLKASEWLSDNLTLHFSATDGLFVPVERPLWQFSIRFRLPRLDEIKPLGIIDVDAQTGDVMPLTRQELQTIRERVHAIIRHHELASAA